MRQLSLFPEIKLRISSNTHAMTSVGSLDAVKHQFFYDRRGNLIHQGLDRARHQRLSKAGAYVRTTARKKLNKTARQKPIASLSRDERIKYHTNLALHTGNKVNRATWQMMDSAERAAFFWQQREIREGKRGRQPKPKRPLMPARRGEAPRKRVGLLREFTYFAFDRTNRSVVVGPADLPGMGDDVPRVLEEGGLSRRKYGSPIPIHPHPYMAPSLAENQSKVPELFRDSI